MEMKMDPSQKMHYGRLDIPKQKNGPLKGTFLADNNLNDKPTILEVC